ncbi:ParA family protein [Vibrio parahaemolyticus]|uniref:ParA family protein n=2 Tax=Vibrio TaxID=662 RepID=UPI00063DD2F4|nr:MULTISPECIES: ParA family protein [Vibrio harveyi group]EGR3221666.1 ParA family protein [Vibrio parahaemolyticus]EHK6545780.1 ParA family protein [Vibrio parahaemolyticus]EJL8716089.1 ParA family protein [Vibrio alginolyticus]EJV5946411.1 ParA family protein [Vibrio parahaemolyticus]EKN4564912.1 ParA family protein [Vibrio parahaemolyticus]
MGKIIIVTAQKGGTGKSAVLSHVAHGLKRRGNSVLILDSDEAPTLKKGYDDRHNYLDLDVIPEDLANDYPLVKRLRPSDPVDKVLEVGVRKYDYVFIDTQGKLGAFEAELISKSDFALMVVGASDLEFEESYDVVKLTNSIAERYNKTIPTIGVLTRVNPKDRYLNSYIRDRVLNEAHGLENDLSDNVIIKLLEPLGFTCYDAQERTTYMTKVLQTKWGRKDVSTISKKRASETVLETEKVIDELLEELAKYG